MSAINVNSITGRTGTHGPVLTGVTTATNGLNVTGGSVGIGTDSPAEVLEVRGDVRISDGSPRLNLYDTNAAGAANATGGFEVFDKDGNRNVFCLSDAPSADNLLLGVTGIERLRINSSGNIGIGTDTPATSNGAVGKLVTVYSGGNNIISGESTAGAGYGLILEGRYDGRSGNERYSQVNLKTDGSNNGQFTISLAAAGGDVSERANFTINGLTFNGDTAAANALDDYEEGSWTPTYYGASTAGTYTLTSTQAKYTKIGNTVHLYVDIKNINESSAGTGLLRIGGLPFTPSNGNEAGSVILEAFSFPGAVEYAVLRTSTLNHLTVVGVRNSGVDIQFNVTDRDSNTSDIFGQITYMTSA